MRRDGRAGGVFAATALAAFGLGWGAVALTAGGAAASVGLAAGLAAAVPVLLLWLAAERLLLEPARRLARGLRAVRESRSADTALASGPAPLPGGLFEECDALVTALRASRRELRKAAQAETARVDAQKGWLEAILQGLGDGVFVCTLQHRIMLYNRAAVDLLGAPDRVGLGRGLGDLLALAPLRHSLTGLEQRHAAAPEAPPELSAPFVCRAAGGGRTFHGRMALLTDPGGRVTGYLVTLADISEEVALLARGDTVRRALTRDLRGMVGNLRAAAETIVDHPAMEPGHRAAFERIVLDESERISARLEELGREISGHLLGRWPMADIYVPDLVRGLDAGLEASGIRAALVGMPLWLHGDSLSLVQVLERLIRQVHAATGAAEFELEPLLGDRRVYLDLVWQGAPVPAGTLDGWLDLPCSAEEGAQRLRDVLERHGSEPWSAATGRPGFARLRLPLLAPSRPQFVPPPVRLPPRPEFYDFGLMRAHQGDAALAARDLRDIDYVVFDCEMTGLMPTQGDEIIQIGAVRVVQGRVLTGEGFERLVNPGRPIPPGSIKFHGLTDADVAGAPSIREVLPAFREFVGDAVLVGHNAAFDMKFISLKQRAAGVAFDNPVLDTMLVSRMLDGDEDDHSLDGLCARYGIAIAGRHTALGDTVGTAELLLKLLDRLEAKGLTRFGEVMQASNMAAELRHRSALVAGGAG
jgi:DNA polymerase-3 subunit epsilon